MSRRNGQEFTASQRNILRLLADGLPHTRKEIHGVLYDELSGLEAVSLAVSYLCALLLPRGENIVCELVNRRICYRHVRLLVAPSDRPR